MSTSERYKAMLTLTPDERRLLNTCAAIASLTPNRYVEALVRAGLTRDGERLGLPLAIAPAPAPIPGQLDLADASSKPAPRRRKADAKVTKESAPRRRTSR